MAAEQSKADRKAALKIEAEKLGISYEELKAQKKAKKAEKRKNSETKKGDSSQRKRKMSESDMLQQDFSAQCAKDQNKRMRSYSHDENGGNEKRRRTRSMDAADAHKDSSQAKLATSVEDWRKEHDLKLYKPQDRDYKPQDPWRTFEETPFCNDIMRAIKAAKYEFPSVIQG